MYSGSIQKGPKLEKNKASHYVNQPTKFKTEGKFKSKN